MTDEEAEVQKVRYQGQGTFLLFTVGQDDQGIAFTPHSFLRAGPLKIQHAGGRTTLETRRSPAISLRLFRVPGPPRRRDMVKSLKSVPESLKELVLSFLPG